MWGPICKVFYMVGLTPEFVPCGFRTIRVFLARKREPWGSDVIYAVFSSVMLLLITNRVATEGVYGQKMWLVNRKHPGGPLACGKAHASAVNVHLGAAAGEWIYEYNISFLSSFQIYRCRVMWDSLCVIAVPSFP